MFDQFNKELQRNFKFLSEDTLFCVPIDRDEIWQQYLSGFAAEDSRQEHNCNCCRSFLRQYGSIVAIKDSKIVSIWDNLNVPEEYEQSVQNLSNYIHSFGVNDVFLDSLQVVGTKQSYDQKRNVTWGHFWLQLPQEVVIDKRQLDTVRGQRRTDKEVFQRGLDELTIDSTETVLDLISQNSLYRGEEFKPAVKEFNRVQKLYGQVAADLKNNFVWQQSRKSFQVNRIRNTAIGTLLIDLSANLELNEALKKYDKVMAPSNYKRTTAPVTAKQVEKAKQELGETGLLESLYRRFATETDLNINNLLFVDKSSQLLDVFQQVAKDAVINPKTLKKVEEISIDNFIENVLPRAKSLEVLVENYHLNNFVSLITAQDNNSPSLFKWDNPFSWSYTNGVTDSIKQNVKETGGNIDGVLRYSIQWNEKGNNNNDFDAWMHHEKGEQIGFNTYKKPMTSPSGGQLDVDVVNPNGKLAVENIYWFRKDNIKPGKHVFSTHNFSSNTSAAGFSAELECDGETYNFEYGKPLRGNERIQVVEVIYNQSGTFTVKPLIDSTSNVTSKEKWNVETNKYTKVRQVMLSPNFWNRNEIGNKHFMFMLENCKPDESEKLAGFYNEFLKNELHDHRKTMEMVASKLEVEKSENPLAGIGFSSTRRNSLIVKVGGAFDRIVKVKF